MSSFTKIVLIGFSGGGKSTVARRLADRLGWTANDVDDEIAAEFGMPIPEIFSRVGESVFRDTERQLLVQALSGENVVIATGGGAVVDPETWTSGLLRSPGTLVVALDVSPERVLSRLREQHALEGDAVERPMLAGNDPLSRILSLKDQRQPSYDQADLTICVDNMPTDSVVEELKRIVAPMRERPAVTLATPSGQSEIYVGPGIAGRLGTLIKERWPKANRIWLVTEENVGRLHMESTLESIREAGYRAEAFAIPPGESSKSLAGAGLLYDWLLDHGIERGDVIVALGGGVIGDLAGFVAATCLRGVGFVQVPTSLLAMVDSSVGGKTGINHRTGKNLIGAFYQPPLVVADSKFLRTLPERELTSGWAEVIKHCVIQRSTPRGEWNDLFTLLERSTEPLRKLEEPALSYVIRRNIALKAAVVEADERETGIRAYLNFGHTLGHAIEAAGYRYLHGEAIAVGMRAASRIAVEMGTYDEASAGRLVRLIERFGLPTCAEVKRDAVLNLISSDKKRAAGTLRWVLPVTGGGVTIRDDVPMSAVVAALNEVSVDSSIASG
jgi:shikimate kinase / 3-dehydroquinate synthase